MLDQSAQLEDRLARAKGKVSACATAARVLLNTGLKHASGFSDEPRVKSTLGCLMLIEWCVPTVRRMPRLQPPSQGSNRRAAASSAGAAADVARVMTWRVR